MSSTENPVFGAPKDHESSTSPQESQPQQSQPVSSPTAENSVAESVSSAIPSNQAQPDDAPAVSHPATGGETTTPVEATAIIPSEQPATAVAQSQSTEAEELKPGAELSSEQEEVEGKESDGPSLDITLLLTTGSRHPFTIDGQYLRKRSVNVENYDPFAMSVYTLKELIWREWRSDWETRPSSPSSIRLISFGKLLDDKSPLSESKFNHDAPNVVHMTVKPQEVVDEEDAKGAKAQYSRERDSNERSPGCRCVIL